MLFMLLLKIFLERGRKLIAPQVVSIVVNHQSLCARCVLISHSFERSASPYVCVVVNCFSLPLEGVDSSGMLLDYVVYVVVIILFPRFISSDSGASDCAVPVVIYFGEPCGKSRIGVGKQDLIRFREPLGEQELYNLSVLICVIRGSLE